MSDLRNILVLKNTTNTAAVSTSSGSTIALAANAARAGWQIQNLGTNALFVALAANGSTTAFHFVLKGSTGQDDGTGGSFSQMVGTVYQGAVTAAGTSPRFAVLEIT